MRKTATFCHAASFTKCSGRQESKEYCLKHYQQVAKHGKPFVTRFDKRPAIIDGDTARIPLGIDAKDGFALVDTADSWVEKHNWSLATNGYAQARVDGKQTLMHTLIIDRPKGKEIDHINRTPTDNRRSNLRVVTHNENMYNLPLAKNNTSGVRGVSRENRRNKWLAQIQKAGRNIFIGYYDTVEEAQAARLMAEAKFFK